MSRLSTVWSSSTGCNGANHSGKPSDGYSTVTSKVLGIGGSLISWMTTRRLMRVGWTNGLVSFSAIDSPLSLLITYNRGRVAALVVLNLLCDKVPVGSASKAGQNADQLIKLLAIDLLLLVGFPQFQHGPDHEAAPMFRVFTILILSAFHVLLQGLLIPSHHSCSLRSLVLAVVNMPAVGVYGPLRVPATNGNQDIRCGLCPRPYALLVGFQQVEQLHQLKGVQRDLLIS